LAAALVRVPHCAKSPDGRTSVVFSTTACDRLLSPPDTVGIRETEWEDSTLLIRANVAVNCAVEISGGDIEVEADTVTATYSVTVPPDVRAKCMCGHELTYRVRESR